MLQKEILNFLVVNNLILLVDSNTLMLDVVNFLKS